MAQNLIDPTNLQKEIPMLYNALKAWYLFKPHDIAYDIFKDGWQEAWVKNLSYAWVVCTENGLTQEPFEQFQKTMEDHFYVLAWEVRNEEVG